MSMEIVFECEIPPEIAPEAGLQQAFDGIEDVFADLRSNANRLILFVMLLQAARDEAAARVA